MAEYDTTVSGVQIYHDFRDNLIIDRYDPVFAMMRGAKLSQLKSENSKDALTWNIFRSLIKMAPDIWLTDLFLQTFKMQFPNQISL